MLIDLMFEPFESTAMAESARSSFVANSRMTTAMTMYTAHLKSKQTTNKALWSFHFVF